jgi:predicted nicotinamide N-methyase
MEHPGVHEAKRQWYARRCMVVSLPRPTELDQTTLHLAGRELPLWHIRDLDSFLGRLMDEQPIFADDDIPYYAWLWPTARIMAEQLLGGGRLDGCRALELGCGTGLVGLAAALQGARVTLTDLQEGARMLAQRNAEAWGVAQRVDVGILDWRTPAHPPVDLLLASDVLYEARFAEPLGHAIHALVKPDGIAVLGDPSRPHAAALTETLAGHGFRNHLWATRTVPEGAEVNIFVASRGELSPRWHAWLGGAPWAA